MKLFNTSLIEIMRLSCIILVGTLFGYVGCMKDSPYWVYGLFSSYPSCQSRYGFSCSNALENEKVMRHAIERNNIHYKIRLPFCSKGILDDKDLMQLLLKFSDTGHINITTGQCINKNFEGSFKLEALFVFSHLTFELTQLASYLLMPLDIPLFAITFQSMYPAPLVRHPLFVYSYQASFGKDIHKNGINGLRKTMGITIGASLNLQSPENTTTYCEGKRKESAFCTYIDLNIQGFCMKEKYVNMTKTNDLEEAVEVVLNNPRLSFVIVQGSSSSYTTFDTTISQMRKQNRNLSDIFFLSFETNDEDLQYNTTKLRRKNVIYNLPGARGMNQLFDYIHTFERKFYGDEYLKTLIKYYDIDEVAKALFIEDPIEFKFLKYIKVQPNHWHLLPKSYKRKFYKKLKYNRKLISSQLTLWKALFYLNIIKITKLLKTKYFNPKAALNAEPFCNLTIPICEAGLELKYSFYQESEWDSSYGWHCERCYEGFYKAIKDENNTKCIPCDPYRRSTDDRLSCYDPYITIYLKLDDKSEWIFMAVSSLHFAFILLTLVVFYRNRYTPLVRASNANISYVQMIIHLFLTTAPFFTFYGKPNFLKCIARPVTIGTLLTTTMAINLGKTQKVLRIFHSKIRQTKTEVMWTKVTEIFTILSLLLLDGAILIMTKAGREISGGSATYYEKTLIKELHCEEDFSMLLQFAYILVIIIANAIQGVRARKLPTQYRETLHVMYASFTSAVVMVAGVGVYMLQSSKYVSSHIMIYVTLALNIVHFGLIYSYKIYILLWRGDLNRSSFFRHQRQKKFRLAIMPHQTDE